MESRVILGKHSYLTGNLKAAIITIEEGAKFDGMCSMIQKESGVKNISEEKNTTNHLSPANEQA